VQEKIEVATDDIETILRFMLGFYHINEGAPDDLFSIEPAHRERVVETGLARITAQVAKLGIPCVEGKLRSGSHIFLNDPDLEAHKALYGPGTICVLEKHTAQHDDRALLDGFEVKVKLEGSDTWLCVGISPTAAFEDEDEEHEEEEPAMLPPPSAMHDINRVAVMAANADGFGVVARNRELRADFVRPIVQGELPESGEPIVHAVAQQAVTFWEFGVVPMRAKELKSSGKKIAEIAEALGITRQRAERAVGMEMKLTLIEKMAEYQAMNDQKGTAP
jgi:hypothetical protein